jgi:hypothetical protein
MRPYSLLNKTSRAEVNSWLNLEISRFVWMQSQAVLLIWRLT